MTRVERWERSVRNVKRAVLAAPGLGRLAASLQARRLERRYVRTLRLYANSHPVTTDIRALLFSRSGDRLKRLRMRAGPLKVLYVGTDYMQDSSGILQALQRLVQVVPFKRDDGIYGQATNSGYLSFALSESNGNRMIELVAKAAEAGDPFHLVIGQMWDGYMPCEFLQRVQQNFRCVVINIAMDDRHTFPEVVRHGRTVSTKGLIPGIDLAATAAPEAVRWYLAEGCPAVFFPEASDPDLFCPMPSLGKAHQVTFVGLNYGIRSRLVASLRRAGISVTTFGSGWPSGRIHTEAVPRLFAQSRVILGVAGVGQSGRLRALKLRDFDAPMSGSCYLTQENDDLRLLFRVGEEIMTYSSPEDLVAKASWLLHDDEARESIAARGRARCLAMHTWDHRFRSLVDLIEGRTAGRADSPPPPTFGLTLEGALPARPRVWCCLPCMTGRKTGQPDPNTHRSWSMVAGCSSSLAFPVAVRQHKSAECWCFFNA